MALVDVFKVGALATESIGNIFHLWGMCLTDNNVSHLRKNFTTAGYQVTAGKTLYLLRVLAYLHTGGANTASVSVGYADNDVGLDTSTARTNGVMALGLDDTGDNGISVAPQHTVNFINPAMASQARSFVWPIAAASKFPFIRYKGTSTIAMNFIAWCIEI